MFQNVVVGKPIIEVETLFATDKKDWEENERQNTLFTETRFLPSIMKKAGIVKSTGEVRRNRPELMITLNSLDFLKIKWGKRYLYIAVGE